MMDCCQDLCSVSSILHPSSKPLKALVCLPAPDHQAAILQHFIFSPPLSAIHPVPPLPAFLPNILGRDSPPGGVGLGLGRGYSAPPDGTPYACQISTISLDPPRLKQMSEEAPAEGAL